VFKVQDNRFEQIWKEFIGICHNLTCHPNNTGSYPTIDVFRNSLIKTRVSKVIFDAVNAV